MKKVMFLIISIFIFGNTYALTPIEFLDKAPTDFSPGCYEYYNKIDKNIVGSKDANYLTYKININNIYDLAIIQNGYVLPYKFYSESTNDIYEFEDNIGLNSKSLYDYNYNTYEEINSKSQNEIVLTFDEELKRNNFSFLFNYRSNNFSPEYYIGDDKINWNKIRKEDIVDFNFKYLKINFVSITKEEYLENIKIYELSFYKKSKTILIKSFFDDDVNIYSKNNCLEKKYFLNKSYNDFGISKNTQIINLDIEKNPFYNVYLRKDIDKDFIEDDVDNCKTIYNPTQLDSNSDGLGDECSDDDKDGIIGNKDNCINIYNPDQFDININKVGDVCEFDKDNDGIFDELDNCIIVNNPNQLDKDKDGIGDLCDNCELYNPRQFDIDLNMIGDKCDEAEKNLLDNDKDEDKIIDYKDNCKEVYNPNQLDKDGDGRGNLCDNCIDIQNSKQVDENENDVGDMCEDSDGDNILGYLDNCISVANSDQLDSDNDGVGNLCEDDDRDNIIYNLDNCPYEYNPEQIDIDKDGIGDKCDKEDNRYIESNSTFFIGLLLFITLIFGTGIFFMIKKLK
ncbi:MAG: thrombospondin type 3 repeat-containing protein [Candidatus Gracilibacteria bacterium]